MRMPPTASSAVRSSMRRNSEAPSWMVGLFITHKIPRTMAGLLTLPTQQQKDAAQSHYSPTHGAHAKSTEWRHIKRQSQSRSGDECCKLDDQEHYQEDIVVVSWRLLTSSHVWISRKISQWIGIFILD